MTLGSNMKMMKRMRSEIDEEVDNINNMAKYLMLLQSHHRPAAAEAAQVFECKTCNRRFSSFQALGGHRASHKKPRNILLQMDEEDHGVPLMKKTKKHECTICGVVFTMGQALGGHMRRHRAAINPPPLPSLLNTSINTSATALNKLSWLLDLNLTPLENDLKLLFGKMPPTSNLQH